MSKVDRCIFCGGQVVSKPFRIDEAHGELHQYFCKNCGRYLG